MEQSINHHAVFLPSTSIEDSALPEELRLASVDVYHLVCDSFGVHEARSLIEMASRKAVSGTGRTFVVVTKAMTLEAQNALLKLLEEPPAGAVFYLLLPNRDLLIPTLQSRLQFGEDIRSYPDTAWINEVVLGASRYVDSNNRAEKLTSAIFVGSRLNGPGASKKMLLEELALTIA